MKVYLLISEESDGYDDNTTWVEGVYSSEEVANKKRIALKRTRELLIQQIEDADKREEVFWAKWEDNIHDEYVAKGFNDDELNKKFSELELESRNGVESYMHADYVNYRVVELKVDEDNGTIIL